MVRNLQQLQGLSSVSFSRLSSRSVSGLRQLTKRAYKPVQNRLLREKVTHEWRATRVLNTTSASRLHAARDFRAHSRVLSAGLFQSGKRDWSIGLDEYH